ncbi:MAG: toxin-antitoxin system HicB family antitoxin [Thiotrichales bacterium]
MNPHDYSITIRHGVFEGEVCFEARVRELPDLAEYADTFEEAYALAIDAIETTAAVLAEKGKPMPLPIDVPDEFSGRVTLRIPKTLHRELARAADDEGVSLNQHMVNVLTYFSGFGAGVKGTLESRTWAASTAPDKPSRPKHLRLVASSQLNQGQDYGRQAG